MSGRRAQAARNNELILEAARAVFLDNPHAPISEVAKHAGVGISALYKRYASKEELLRKLCHDGLATWVAETERALKDESDPWTVFEQWAHRLVDADTSSLTAALAGTFAPTEEMYALAERANDLSVKLFDRVRTALRPDIEQHDLSVLFEIIAAVKLSDRARTMEMRHRYLDLLLDGLRTPDPHKLACRPPGWREINERWSTG